MSKAAVDGTRYVITLTAAREDSVLLRVAGLLWRKRVSIASLVMEDDGPARRFEIGVDVPPERLGYICAQLQRLVDVYEVVVCHHREGGASGEQVAPFF